MTAPDLAIARSICDVIRGMSPTVTPHSTLAVPYDPATPGQVALVDASHFTRGGRFTFCDGTAEESLRIADVTGNVATLDFTNVGYSALQFAHLAGTAVTTNLFPTRMRQPSIGPMLAKGDPVVWVYVRQKTAPGVAAFGEIFPCFVAHVQYHRLLSQGEDAPMDPGVYADRQETASRNDMHAIWTALLDNPHLVSDSGPTVTGFELGDHWADWQWDHLALDAGNVQFVAAVDIRYTGNREFVGD